MPELDPFDARLAAAVHAFADRAETRVDAMAVAERAVGRRRAGVVAWLTRAVPVPVYTLIALGLLLGALAVTAQVGGPWNRPAPVIPAPTSAPAPAATPAPTATPTPVPPTDGKGDERVVGTFTMDLSTPYTQSVVGDVVRYRGGVATVTLSMNDGRVSGTAAYSFSVDVYSVAGSEWGSLDLVTDQGSWKGPCSGGSWTAGSGLLLSCWLSGSGAYDGYTYYLVLSKPVGESPAAEGIVYPGEPPAQ
jgi:hypothetical protein